VTDSKLILLVDDHPLFRHGLKSLLAEAFSDMTVVEAGSISEARTVMTHNNPGIAVLDVTLPDGDGISFAGDFVPEHPECRFYILTMHRRSGLLVQARNSGCRGYFLKEGDGGSLIDAIRTNEEQFQISPQLKDLLEPADGERDTANHYARLTRREKELFRLFAEGLGYKEVAWKLGISPRTASVHRYNIFQKLKISSEVELFKAAQDVGLLI